MALFALYLAVGFGLRTWIQWRSTRDSGFRGVSRGPGSPEWWAGVLFVLAIVTGFLGPVMALAGLAPLPLPDAPPLQATGVVLTVVGIAATYLTQVDMGTSWRIGVEAGERTDLVTTGAFALVRNLNRSSQPWGSPVWVWH